MDGKHRLTITGASDDLVEIDGDIREEFGQYDSNDKDDKLTLAVSDGTLLGVCYDEDGLWRFKVLCHGRAKLTKTEGSVGADTNDVVELLADEPFAWVAMGNHRALRS